MRESEWTSDFCCKTSSGVERSGDKVKRAARWQDASGERGGGSVISDRDQVRDAIADGTAPRTTDVSGTTEVSGAAVTVLS